jgi:hypothetical protein
MYQATKVRLADLNAKSNPAPFDLKLIGLFISSTGAKFYPKYLTLGA